MQEEHREHPHLPASGAAVTTLTSGEPFGERGSCVTITLSLSGAAVHLLLAQLVQTLGLGAGNLVANTVLASVHATNTTSARHGARNAVAVLGGCVATIDIHHVGVFDSL